MEESTKYTVLINEEGQYSLWWVTKPIPLGWQQVGPLEGSKSECLAYIDAHWTDMKPRSLQRQDKGS